VKSDIAEYSHNLGFPGLNDSISPCIWCFGTPDLETFYSTAGLSPLGSGFVAKTEEAYREACRKCETKLRLSPADRNRVVRNLDYDKRKKDGAGGRALSADIPELGLSKGFRIEPSAELPNVGDLETVSAAVEVTFWNHKQETSTRHRNPLFSDKTGVTSDCLGIDIMHTSALGTTQFVIHPLMWRLVEVNVFKVVGAAATVRELTFGRIKEMLFQWLSVEAQAGRRHSQPQQFASTFFGTPSSYSCRLHAAETLGVAKFLLMFLLGPHGACLGRELPLYRSAIGSAVSMFELVRIHPRRLPAEAQQEFIHCIAEHLRSIRALRISCRPKHHVMIELGGKFT
jgi:hypothetical protein